MRDRKTYAERISASWHRSIDSIFETAQLCAEANACLSKDDKAALLADLPFPAATFSKLVKIGNDARLRKPGVRCLLPPCYSIIYEVALLSDEHLAEATASGTLHPEMKRVELQEFATKAEADSNPSPIVLGVIQLPPDYPVERLQELHAELQRTAAAFGVEFVRRATPEESAQAKYARAMNAYFARWIAATRVLARRRIRELKSQRLRGCERWSRASKDQRWGFHEDEIYIGADYGWGQIAAVLDYVGVGHEFESLRARAEELVTPPQCPFEPESEEGLPELPYKISKCSVRVSDWK
jgi:hypothetical protein